MNTNYKIECWGASGGTGGPAAYTKGYIDISENFILYVYVGEKGNHRLSNYDQPVSGTFNGGGGFFFPYNDKNNSQGGGATDIRILDGNWDSFNSLKSRIMVAAGGGCIIYDPQNVLSYGGALSSFEYQNTYNGAETNAAQRASQTSGYKFGIGQDGGRAGGGGGYYGGCAIGKDELNLIGMRGAGGSSFISGYTGCDAISEFSTEDNIIHTGQPNHYSGKVFTNTVMKAGNESMPSPTGGTETGHSGNGYCKITWHPAL
jgi:hypothetical protein